MNTFTQADINAVFEFRAVGKSLRQIAKLMDCSHEWVSSILRREVHGDAKVPVHLIAKAARNSSGPRTLRRQEGIVEAVKYASRGFTQVEIAANMGVTQPTVSRWLKAAHKKT